MAGRAEKVWEPFPGSQERFLSCPVWEVLLHGNRGGGKSQPLDALILYPDGYKFMGNVKIGDKIVNPNGGLTKIVGIYPQGLRKVFKIKLEDSRIVFSCGEHLWDVAFNKEGTFFETYSTEKLREFCNFSDIFIPVLDSGVKKVQYIVPFMVQDCQCIKVDSEDGLYVTNNEIVTHNTDVLLMDFLQGVGIGYGIDYKGLLLREATTELGDVISKSKKWIPRIFPTAKFNNQKKVWSFDDGETLWLNYARVEDDYEQYHGHEYPWIGWEELTNHPLPNVYLKLMSCNRSANIDIPRKYRSTCNPSGPGHQWVKDRFIDKVPQQKIYYDDFKQSRTHIQSNLMENKALLAADPAYQAKLLAMTQDNKMLRDAWVYGSWDLISGGFFTDVWDKNLHVLTPFKIPKSWSVFRSFDWGSSKPWCVTYGAESNGEQPNPVPGVRIPFFPRGSVVIINEIYGWNGSANEGDRATSQEIAERVVGKDHAIMIEYKTKVTPGPADTSIWDVRDGTSIAASLALHRCRWTKAYKGSGSRISGWAMIRQMLGAAKRGDLESPHLYFFDLAQHHIRTLPIMQRDKKKPEDIDTDLEDHAMDSLRYLLTRKMMKFKRRKVGM